MSNNSEYSPEQLRDANDTSEALRDRAPWLLGPAATEAAKTNQPSALTHDELLVAEVTKDTLAKPSPWLS